MFTSRIRFPSSSDHGGTWSDSLRLRRDRATNGSVARTRPRPGNVTAVRSKPDPPEPGTGDCQTLPRPSLLPLERKVLFTTRLRCTGLGPARNLNHDVPVAASRRLQPECGLGDRTATRYTTGLRALVRMTVRVPQLGSPRPGAA
jgi:hypothetical protein